MRTFDNILGCLSTITIFVSLAFAMWAKTQMDLLEILVTSGMITYFAGLFIFLKINK